MQIPTITEAMPTQCGPGRFWIVFCDNLGAPTGPAWFSWFTSPGFRHIMVLTEARLGTITINPLAQGIFTQWAPFAPEACAIACARRGWTVLAVNSMTTDDFRFRGVLQLRTCVAVAKALLGVNDWRIITPRQLYDFLKPNAREVTR